MREKCAALEHLNSIENLAVAEAHIGKHRKDLPEAVLRFVSILTRSLPKRATRVPLSTFITSYAVQCYTDREYAERSVTLSFFKIFGDFST